MKLMIKTVALVTAFSFAGCASIVSTSDWPVTVMSNPLGAKCVVAKENGELLHSSETPFALTLSAKEGFFQSAKYTISCQKDGYQTAKLDVPCSLNAWYFGNIVFGGLIGLLIVDPATGAMWKLENTQVVDLAKI